MHNRPAGRHKRTGTNRPNTRIRRTAPNNEGSDTDVDETFYHRYRSTHQQSSTTTDEVIRRSGRTLPRNIYAADGASSPIPHVAREVGPTPRQQQAQHLPWPLSANTGSSENIANGQTMQTSTPRREATMHRERLVTNHPTRLSPSEGWHRPANQGDHRPIETSPNTEPTSTAPLRVSPYFSTPPNRREL